MPGIKAFKAQTCCLEGGEPLARLHKIVVVCGTQTNIKSLLVKVSHYCNALDLLLPSSHKGHQPA